MDADTESMRCLACGYEIGGLSCPACPECGLALDESHLAAARARGELERELPRTIIRHAVRWVIVILVYGIGAGVVSRSLVGGAVSIAMLGIGIFGTGLIGWAGAMPARPWERGMLRTAWLRALPWLHGPWLMTAPAAAIILAVALIDRWSYNDGLLVGTLVIVGFLLWLLGVAGCFAGAMKVFGGTIQRHTPPGAPWPGPLATGALVVLFLVVLAACSVVGLRGGGAAIEAALTLVRPIWNSG